MNSIRNQQNKFRQKGIKTNHGPTTSNRFNPLHRKNHFHFEPVDKVPVKIDPRRNVELNPFFLFSFCCNVCIFSLGRFERRVADIKHRALNNKKRTSLPASRNRLLYWHGAGRDGADTHLFYSLFPHVFFLPSQRACPFDGEDVWRFLILCVWIKKTDAGGIVFLLGSFLCDEKEREREKKWEKPVVGRQFFFPR